MATEAMVAGVERELLASVSHDLRNPLATIRAAVELIHRLEKRTGSVPQEHLASALNAIQTAEQRMAEMIDSLIDRSLVETRRGPGFERRSTDLGELARESASQQQAITTRHQIRVEADQAVLSLCHPPSIRRVLGNLLDNAMKYAPRGGPILVAVRAEKSPHPVAILTVTDFGIGIPPGDLPRIFDPFVRGSNASDDVPGNGIGLATSAQIVEEHGGTMTAESELGKGSTFTVTLPLYREGAL